MVISDQIPHPFVTSVFHWRGSNLEPQDNNAILRILCILINSKIVRPNNGMILKCDGERWTTFYTVQIDVPSKTFLQVLYSPNSGPRSFSIPPRSSNTVFNTSILASSDLPVYLYQRNRDYGQNMKWQPYNVRNLGKMHYVNYDIGTLVPKHVNSF